MFTNLFNNGQTVVGQTTFVEAGQEFTSNGSLVSALDPTGRIRVIGNSNTIRASNSAIQGHWNTVYGDDNWITGNYNTVYGRRNVMYGNQNHERSSFPNLSISSEQATTPFIGQNFGNALIINIDNGSDEQESSSSSSTSSSSSSSSSSNFPTKEELKHDILLTDAHHPDDACVICLERKRTCIIRPCKHASLCVKCSTPDIKQCPICRVQVVSIEHA